MRIDRTGHKAFHRSAEVTVDPIEQDGFNQGSFQDPVLFATGLASRSLLAGTSSEIHRTGENECVRRFPPAPDVRQGWSAGLGPMKEAFSSGLAGEILASCR